jgi:elongation factor P
MAMLEYSDIRTGKIIIHEEEPCLVVDNHVARTQQRKPQNQVKLKSLLSGRTWNTTFHASDKAEEAEISKKEVKFLFVNKGEYWFCDPQNPSDRFKLEEKIISDQIKFLQPNGIVESVIWNNEDDEEQIINVKLPIKMEFVIKDCPPTIKGATANGGNKIAVLENGTTVNVPLFLNPGEKIRVNTETGEYVERVQA